MKIFFKFSNFHLIASVELVSLGFVCGCCVGCCVVDKLRNNVY